MAEKKYRVFISSSQKELEPERLALFALITTDSFQILWSEACSPSVEKAVQHVTRSILTENKSIENLSTILR